MRLRFILSPGQYSMYLFEGKESFVELFASCPLTSAFDGLKKCSTRLDVTCGANGNK